MTQLFEKQMDETRIIRGSALSMHGNSYLDRAQQVAEMESVAKLNRFVRDIPKYERQKDYQDREAEEGDGDTDIQAAIQDLSEFNDRDTIEDALFF